MSEREDAECASGSKISLYESSNNSQTISTVPGALFCAFIAPEDVYRNGRDIPIS